LDISVSARSWGRRTWPRNPTSTGMWSRPSGPCNSVPATGRATQVLGSLEAPVARPTHRRGVAVERRMKSTNSSAIGFPIARALLHCAVCDARRKLHDRASACCGAEVLGVVESSGKCSCHVSAGHGRAASLQVDVEFLGRSWPGQRSGLARPTRHTRKPPSPEQSVEAPVVGMYWENLHFAEARL
jgi:hypothetical protein